MKRLLLLIALHVLICRLSAQVTGNFTVQGDIDKFYPVVFLDGGWGNNVATELAISRPSVHMNSNWRGSVMARFRFHLTNYGHRSHFIDADIKQFSDLPPASNAYAFVAGWYDATTQNSNSTMIVWLKGGGTTYFYQSNYPVSPAIYDGVQNPLPYQEPVASYIQNHTYKTAVESYVNSFGQSNAYTAYFNGDGASYFKGKVGIGTLAINEAGFNLFVDAGVRARKVKVDQDVWSDYVFDSAYRLRSIAELEKYIQENKHLPEVPSAAKVEKDGLDLGDAQATLLKKIEELTLYMIEQNKIQQAQSRQIKMLQQENKKMQRLLKGMANAKK